MKLYLATTSFLVSLLVLNVPAITQEPSTSYSIESTQQSDREKEPQEIVVTATRIETPTEEVASSITVISSQQIEEKQQATVLEVLRSVPALDVVRTGGIGGQTSVFIRGAKAEHTLVLIDGIEMNDPITPGRIFNFANLTTDNVERIEIIRGPQSTLYGSDAIGGVINIITKRGKGKPSGFVSGEYGSFDTYRGSVGLNGGIKLLNYSLGLSHLDTDGISAANRDDGNRERDDYNNTSLSGRLGITPAENLDINFIIQYLTADTDIDNAGGTNGDDPNNKGNFEQLFFRTQIRLSLFDDRWEQKVGVSLAEHDQNFRNSVDATHPIDFDRSTFDGRTLKFDWQNNLHLHETNTLTFGAETEEEKGESFFMSDGAFGPFTSVFGDETARTNGYYIQDQIKLWDSWFTTLGVRVDDHSKFGSEVTFRISTAYLFRETGTKLKATYGTGFKAPSLFQLYSSFGDTTLDPEKSIGWDIGIEQALWDEKITLGVTYFENEFDDMVDFDNNMFIYANIAEAETSGIEVFLMARPTDDLSLSASYSYTDTEDKTTGRQLIRRARNKIGFDANYRFNKKGAANLGIIYGGKRDDNDFSTFPATRVELTDYVLVNVSGTYDFTEHFKIFGRIENLLDDDYEEVKGFGTPGIAAYSGFKLSF